MTKPGTHSPAGQEAIEDVELVQRQAGHDPDHGTGKIRYLRGLVSEYHGNVNMALLVYNRGPVAGEKARAQGDNPSNGYDRILTKGYKGKGTVD